MTAPPRRVGLDLIKGAVRDNKKAGVLEPAVSKIKSLKFATEAAITILRINTCSLCLLEVGARSCALAQLPI